MHLAHCFESTKKNQQKTIILNVILLDKPLLYCLMIDIRRNNEKRKREGHKDKGRKQINIKLESFICLGKNKGQV